MADNSDAHLAITEALSSVVSKDQILALQKSLIPIRCDLPDPTHFFAPGMYLRELTIPAGMVVVGKTHRHSHFLIVTKGRAEVVSEFGRNIVESGHISVSQAGEKRAVYSIEDTQFITVHLNKEDSTDLVVIEADHIEPEFLFLDEDVTNIELEVSP